MLKTNQVRNQEIVRLRDQERLKFEPIADIFDITTSRAHQIYWEEKKRAVTNTHKKVRVGLSDVAKAFGTTPDKLELVIPQQSVIIKS